MWGRREGKRKRQWARRCQQQEAAGPAASVSQVRLGQPLSGVRAGLPGPLPMMSRQGPLRDSGQNGRAGRLGGSRLPAPAVPAGLRAGWLLR